MVWRRWPLVLIVALCSTALALSVYVLVPAASLGSSPRTGRIEAVWGRPGKRAGLLYKPRAIAIDQADNLYLVDKMARIHVFNRSGEFLRSWTTPESKFGKPTGLSISNDGLLMVADTHYYRVLFYELDGTLRPERTLGGTRGTAGGQMGWVTDVVQDVAGNYFVSEYGECDRIQMFNAAGEFILQWGKHGTQPGDFSRPQSLALDRHGRLWVADSCNHRIQVFDVRQRPPRLVKILGGMGKQLGQLRYPYALVLDQKDHVYICEFGNHRVQKWTLQGEPVGVWGAQGRARGELFNPWSLAQDSRGAFHVVDTYNHRIYRIRL